MIKENQSSICRSIGVYREKKRMFKSGYKTWDFSLLTIYLFDLKLLSIWNDLNK